MDVEQKCIKQFEYYSVPENDFSKRNAEDILEQEYANAIEDILEKSISLPEDILIKETAKVSVIREWELLMK